MQLHSNDQGFHIGYSMPKKCQQTKWWIVKVQHSK